MLEALHIHLRLSESSGRIIFERQLDSLRLKFDYSTTNDRRIVRSSLIRNRKTPNSIRGQTGRRDVGSTSPDAIAIRVLELNLELKVIDCMARKRSEDPYSDITK
jgi:hypothetical protein